MITGHELRNAREERQIGIGRLADLIGRDKGHISRVERGDREVTPALVTDYERALDVRLTSTEPSKTATNPDRPSTPVTNNDLETMRSFRAADLQVGGGRLYKTVVGYLYNDLAPRLFGGHGAEESMTEVFAAAGGLTELAGWMAHDAGRDDLARTHFERAFELASMGTDRQLQVHTLASLSHLANQTGLHDSAIGLARRGRTILTGHRQPTLEARLIAMEARGQAALDNATECRRLLVLAEHLVGNDAEVQPSPWVSGFDAGSLASETFRCAIHLRMTGEARRAAKSVISQRQGRGRSQALGHLNLATVSLMQNEPDVDAACVEVERGLDTSQALSSSAVDNELARLGAMLHPYKSAPDVSALVARIEGRRLEADTGERPAAP